MAGTRKYYWLKLKSSFFDEKAIRFLRKMPSGDSMVIVYLKLLCASLKTEGYLKHDGILPCMEEELALMIDEDENIVKMTINALVTIRQAEFIDNENLYFFALNEMIGKESESAERVRRYRDKQKALHCNGVVTNGNTEIDIEIEKEIYNNMHSPEDERESDTKKLEQQEADFKLIYAIYPKKVGRTRAFDLYQQWLKGKKVNGKRRTLSNRQIYLAVQNYVDQQQEQGISLEYYKNFDTLMGKQLLDYVEVEQNG